MPEGRLTDGLSLGPVERQIKSNSDAPVRIHSIHRIVPVQEQRTSDGDPAPICKGMRHADLQQLEFRQASALVLRQHIHTNRRAESQRLIESQDRPVCLLLGIPPDIAEAW